MAEPIITIGLGAIGAYLGKDGIEKILGPTAEYLGNGLRDLAQKRIENVGRIFQKAERKLGDKIDSPGEVPPRVLKTILDEGSFCDDELASEYFGGILASSRTESGRDDRGARISKILDGLSSYQIRAHYLIYSSISNVFLKSGIPFNMEGRPKMQIFIPFSGFFHAMDFNQEESNQLSQLLTHIFFGLASEDLIERTDWQYGTKEHIKKIFPGATESGILCQPSALGAELFLWAFGLADKSLEYILKGECQFEVNGVSAGIPGVLPTQPLITP